MGLIQKAMEKYRLMSKPVKASIWFIVSNIMLRGMSFITLPVFSRILTTSEYGVVSVYQSWVGIFSIVTTLTIWGGVFNVGLVNYSDRRKELISAFQGLAITITLFFMAISMPFLTVLSKKTGLSEMLIFVMYLEILVQIPFNLWATEQRYLFQYKGLIFFTLLISLFSPLIGYFAVVSTPYRAEARIITNFAVQAVFGIILFLNNQIKGKKYFSLEFWKMGFSFNVVLIPHYLSTQILNQSDRIMINLMCGSSEAGIYSVAYSFAMLLSLVVGGINSSLTPHIYQCLKEGNTKELGRQTTSIVFIVAIMAIGLECVIPDIFTFLLPDSYHSALKVVPPVTAGAFFLFLYPLFGSVEFYYKENKYVTIASMIGAVLNVGLNYIFIKLFGFIAAAYTTLLCYVLFSVCHYFFMKKIMKTRHVDVEIYNMKAMVIISLAVIIISIVMVPLYDVFYIRWGIMLFTLIFLIIKRKDAANMARKALQNKV